MTLMLINNDKSITTIHSKGEWFSRCIEHYFTKWSSQIRDINSGIEIQQSPSLKIQKYE
jgi:hypothetical protein